jgi:hypothetical protein
MLAGAGVIQAGGGLTRQEGEHLALFIANVQGERDALSVTSSIISLVILCNPM